MGVCLVPPVAVRAVGVCGVELMRRVLQVRRWVEVVVVVIRRRVLRHVAELGVVSGGGCVRICPGRVVQVGRMRRVRDEGRVRALGCRTGRPDTSGPKQRSQQG